MPSVARLSVSPVKGLGLVHPEALELHANGIPGDRAFYLADAADGRMVNGKLAGTLVQVAPAYDAATGRLSLTLPGGAVVEDDASALGAPVETSFYGRPVTGRFVEGPFSAALSELAGRALRLVRTDATSAACDCLHPVSVLSTASCAELARQSGDPRLADDRRFRMHVLLDGCALAHEEDTWAGRELRVGEAVIRLVGPLPRCLITGQDPATGEGDHGALKAIVAYRGQPREGAIDFGMYADIVTPGRVCVGDRVELVG